MKQTTTHLAQPLLGRFDQMALAYIALGIVSAFVFWRLEKNYLSAPEYERKNHTFEITALRIVKWTMIIMAISFGWLGYRLPV